ncbi:hypothetical protein WMY93_033711 [Mugilogobius chulae]|uniref:Uncharacterized protein n=1 Tax=Mugilogobius chulae TaxID=88201 RepID=A0AAW0MGJ5_9GOBI
MTTILRLLLCLSWILILFSPRTDGISRNLTEPETKLQENGKQNGIIKEDYNDQRLKHFSATEQRRFIREETEIKQDENFTNAQREHEEVRFRKTDQAGLEKERIRHIRICPNVWKEEISELQNSRIFDEKTVDPKVKTEQKQVSDQVLQNLENEKKMDLENLNRRKLETAADEAKTTGNSPKLSDENQTEDSEIGENLFVKAAEQIIQERGENKEAKMKKKQEQNDRFVFGIFRNAQILNVEMGFKSEHSEFKQFDAETDEDETEKRQNSKSKSENVENVQYSEEVLKNSEEEQNRTNSQEVNFTETKEKLGNLFEAGEFGEEDLSKEFERYDEIQNLQTQSEVNGLKNDEEFSETSKNTKPKDEEMTETRLI